MARNREFINELKIAYHKLKKEKGIGLIETAFRKAYESENPAVLIALLKKLVPDKIEGDGIGSTAVIYNLIQQLQGDFQKDRSPSMALGKRDGVDSGSA